MKKAFGILLAFLIALTSAGCETAKETSASNIPDVNINETQPLVVGVENLNQNVNPLFANTMGTKAVAEIMNTRLVSTKADGTLAFSNGENALARDVQITFKNELGEIHNEYQDGDSVTYTFVIKNGMKFSDGSKISADDVMFTLYTLLDPLYDGAYPLSSLKIDGLERYVLQMTPEIKEQYTDFSKKFLENGKDGEYTDEEKPLADAFYTTVITQAGEKYCKVAVDYVAENYLTDEYVARYLSEEITAAQVSESETLKIAYAMIVWEVGAFNEEGKFVVGNKVLDLNTDTLTLQDFWNELYLAKKEISKIDEDAVGENTVSAIATEIFVNEYGPKGMNEKISEISGLQKGETLIDNTPFETVSVTVLEYLPEHVYSFAVPVVSRACYTKGFNYPSTTVTNGVALNCREFMDHLKQTAPEVVSGAYKMSVGPLGKFFEDDVCYLSRNDQFSSITGQPAKIKNLCFVNKTSQNLTDITGGAYSLSQITLDETSAQELVNNQTLGFVTAPNNAYGYILINPRYYPDINERIALTMLLNTNLAVDYYPQNTAKTINRSYSYASYVYPTAPTLYPYSESDDAVKEYFTKAGYTFEEGKMLTSTGDTAKFVFTLPTTADKHPSGAVFEKAVSRLVSLGATAEIAVSETLTQDIYTPEGVGIYALARNLTNDVDMRTTFDYSSVSETVKANGISWLWENGGSEDIGTVQINETQYTQEKALEHLSDLVKTGAQITDYTKRREYYVDALNTLEKLCIEIPVYQRNTVFVYNKTALDLTALPTEFSAFNTPFCQLYKVKFK